VLRREVEDSGQVEHSTIGGAPPGGRVSSCIGALDVRMNGLEVARMEMPEGRMHDSVAHKTRLPSKAKESKQER
jgi:hypothetical protein